MTSCGSFIDDRFAAVTWPQAEFNNSSNDGPRDGRWSVSSKVGSWIDNCPAPGHKMTAVDNEKSKHKAKSHPHNADIQSTTKKAASTRRGLAFDGMDLDKLSKAIEQANAASPDAIQKPMMDTQQQTQKQQSAGGMNLPRPVTRGKGKLEHKAHKRMQSSPAFVPNPNKNRKSGPHVFRQASNENPEIETAYSKKRSILSRREMQPRCDDYDSAASCIQKGDNANIVWQTESVHNKKFVEASSKYSSKHNNSNDRWDHTSYVYEPARESSHNPWTDRFLPADKASVSEPRFSRRSSSAKLRYFTPDKTASGLPRPAAKSESNSYNSLEDAMNYSSSSGVDSWVKNSSISGLEGYLSHHTNEFGQPHQTVFAGHGWIPPHPLSLDSGSNVTRPQSQIHIQRADGRGVVTMTFGDWQRLHDDELSSVRRYEQSFTRQPSQVSPPQHPVAQRVSSRDPPSPQLPSTRSHRRSASPMFSPRGTTQSIIDDFMESRSRARARAQLEAAYRSESPDATPRGGWSSVSQIHTFEQNQSQHTHSTVSPLSLQHHHSLDTSRNRHESSHTTPFRSRRMDESDALQLEMPWDDDW